MKSADNVDKLIVDCHSPCGECGLKYDNYGNTATIKESLPMRGVWIEMIDGMANGIKSAVTPHAGSVD